MPVLGLGPLPREQFRDTIAPLVTHLDQAFGPQRTFWASNYPIDKPNVSLPDSIWALREILGERFDEDRMLRANAGRVYRV
jgi:predicted TIM-barrel fold metal-dependent hydrolase